MDGGLEWNISDYNDPKFTRNHYKSLKLIIFQENASFLGKKTPAGMPTGVANGFWSHFGVFAKSRNSKNEFF